MGGGRLEEEDKRQRRVEKTIRRGGEVVAGSTSPLTKGKRGRDRYTLSNDTLLNAITYLLSLVVVSRYLQSSKYSCIKSGRCGNRRIAG